MMPQRVPYTVQEAPARTPATAAAVAGYGRAAIGIGYGGHDMGSHHMVPDSPESCAHSDTSGFADGAGVALEHKGISAR